MHKFFNSLQQEESLFVENTHPIHILGLVNKKDISSFQNDWQSAYIVALETTTLETTYGIYPMAKNSTAVIPTSILNTITTSQAWIIFSKENVPMQINGPIESEGRLKYIDGAKDSIAIQPAKMGLPCLNIMYFPPGINQHNHTHPSLRVAVVIEGDGTCNVADKNYDLHPGRLLVMAENIIHAFQSDTRLVVATYHPDSENGPTDEAHPMLSRTYIDDKPVIESMPEIITK